MGLPSLPHLHTLDVSHNRLRCIHRPAGTSSGADHTAVLSLEEARPARGCWRGCVLHLTPSLTHLDLSNNALVGLRGIEGAVGLRHLLLVNNKLRKLSHLETLVRALPLPFYL